ncbi:DNA polymerase alpha 70 kD subunit, putative [Ixodes scapularis]|uniref:DNA polymerase alpha 70 kD subunit, putative n=1 Tax=Ixodes scapularis TaxID=6945 RepID=B7P994_IXOSC|nr:DNA polymerase alpha 70 kD subunit, putative [Ixodes scapularis]|eukprot:XP_002403775.1 DNA polymerase alpha 70 kD subunit, putative [Ixodes scapularis]
MTSWMAMEGTNRLSVAAKYASRANAGDVVARLRNQEGEPADWHCTDGATVSVRPLGAGVSSSYMFENLIEKADALIDYAERIPSLYLDDMEDRPFEDIKSVVMEGSFVTGRVLCDSSGKINANSLILEGSKSSYGHSVKLNLSRLKQFSVFPGQVIVAKGANANGQNLVLEELLERIHCVPDPCVLDINGVVVGATGVDILLHMGKEELSLYVAPTYLTCRFRDVNGCVCINPEHMVKGLVGGSFARVIVRPVDKGSYSGSIVNDTTAEVVKI